MASKDKIISYMNIIKQLKLEFEKLQDREIERQNE